MGVGLSTRHSRFQIAAGQIPRFVLLLDGCDYGHSAIDARFTLAEETWTRHWLVPELVSCSQLLSSKEGKCILEGLKPKRPAGQGALHTSLLRTPVLL